MTGSPKATFNTTLAVLRPTPAAARRLRVRGTCRRARPEHLAGLDDVLRLRPVQPDGAHVPGQPVRRRARRSPRAFATRNNSRVVRLTPVGGLRRQDHRHEQLERRAVLELGRRSGVERPAARRSRRAASDSSLAFRAAPALVRHRAPRRRGAADGRCAAARLRARSSAASITARLRRAASSPPSTACASNAASLRAARWASRWSRSAWRRARRARRASWRARAARASSSRQGAAGSTSRTRCNRRGRAARTGRSRHSASITGASGAVRRHRVDRGHDALGADAQRRVDPRDAARLYPRPDSAAARRDRAAGRAGSFRAARRTAVDRRFTRAIASRRPAARGCTFALRAAAASIASTGFAATTRNFVRCRLAAMKSRTSGR